MWLIGGNEGSFFFEGTLLRVGLVEGVVVGECREGNSGKKWSEDWSGGAIRVATATGTICLPLLGW